MKNLKSPGQKAAAHRKGIKKDVGLTKGKIKPSPRWLAPRPYFAPAFNASPLAFSGGSTGVKVTMTGRDLGIDKQGYREESQKKATPTDNKFSWIHTGEQKGLTLPHDTTNDAGKPIPENQPWPNYWTMVVKVMPADRVEQVTFAKSGDEPDCIDFQKGSVNKKKGEISVQVTAKAASTPVEKDGKKVRRTNGSLIIASYKGVPISQAKFYVVQPKYIKRGPDLIFEKDVDIAKFRFLATYEGQPARVPVPPFAHQLVEHAEPPDFGFFENIYGAWIDVNLLDQYEEPLSAFYAGTSVEEDGAWIAWSVGKKYLDPVASAQGTLEFSTDPQGHGTLKCVTPAPLPWILHDSHAIGLAGWPLEMDKRDSQGNPVPFKRQLDLRETNPPSPNIGNMPAKLYYILKWEN